VKLNKATKTLQTSGSSHTPSQRDRIRNFFDTLSSSRTEIINSNPIISYEQEVRAQTVLNLLSVSPGERVLDIGCGDARDILMLANSGAEIVGLDISPGMVQVARQELDRNCINNVTLIVGDASNLDFPDSYFDKILCSEVIEHIPEIRKSLMEMRRVLKPGGTLVLSTPNRASLYGFERYYIWQGLLQRPWPHPCDEWKTIDELSTLLADCQFGIRTTGSVCFVPGFIITYFLLPQLAQRLLIRLLAKIEPILRRVVRYSGYTLFVKAVRST